MFWKKKQTTTYKVTYKEEKLTFTEQEFEQFLEHCNKNETWSSVTEIKKEANDNVKKKN